MRVLTVNAGSSSLKLRLVDSDDTLIAQGEGLPHRWPDADAVAHRVVHGGTHVTGPVVVDDEVEARLHALTELAPLHQPVTLAALAAARAGLPDVPHVACVDTAFHRTMPPSATTYPLPADWVDRYALRRYGFHGLSHSWAAQRARAMLPGCRRVVTCHLGAGASLCAVQDGRSVDTTMGFTPLDGLVMATRSGSLDPGLVLWLGEREPELGQVLEHGSGLLALGGSADLAVLLARADQRAELAVAVYLRSLRAGIAAMAASLGGVDACVFTGGVGEHAPQVRLAALDGLGFLGLAVDPVLNSAARGDVDVSTPTAVARTLRVECREDLEMARLTRELLNAR